MLQSVLAAFVLLALVPANFTSGDVRNRDPFADPPSVPKDVSPVTVITMQRTECFGTCPVYKLTIFADGRVRYEGSKHVKKKGKAESHISRQKLQELIDEFENIYYFNLNDAYVRGSKGCPQWVPDMPSAITSLTRIRDGERKTVNHYHGCHGPDVLELLTRLEDKIDDAVNVNQWIK